MSKSSITQLGTSSSSSSSSSRGSGSGSGVRVRMTFPTPVLSGTLGFFLGCLFLLGVLKVGQFTGNITKDNTGIGFTVVIMSTISMWMLWSMAWFHQWHPLITPEFP